MKKHLNFLLPVLLLGALQGVAQASPTDLDDDGLPDTEEASLGTNPLDEDSDDDGLSDGDEVLKHATSPLQLDTDRDGLYDGEEIEAGTKTLDPDSDDDGLEDGYEASLETNPLDLDSDDDGAWDGEEIAAATEADIADTDGDGASDGLEVSVASDPLLFDSDGDGLHDGTELAIEFDPTSTDTDENGENDQQSVVRLSQLVFQLQPAGNPHQIQFTALPHVSYDVMYSETLLTWDKISEIDATAQPTVHTVPEPVAGKPKAFFNLKPR